MGLRFLGSIGNGNGRMTIQEIKEVVLAAEAGKAIEYQPHGRLRWYDMQHNEAFNFAGADYRVKREPIVRWMVVTDEDWGSVWGDETAARAFLAGRPGKVIKLVEEM